MRTLLITLFILITGFVNAQVSVSALAGLNTNNVHRSDSYNDIGGGTGWQAGLQVAYQLKHWFVYSGAQLDKNVYYVNYYYPSGPAKYTFHPLYLTVPVGAGYQFALSKKLSVKLFGGVYNSVGISGKTKITAVICGDFGACPQNPPSETRTTKINYGNTNNDDLAKTNAGLQFGAAVRAWKKLELSCAYNVGLANINPKDYNSKLKINSFAINAKIELVTFGHK